MITSSYILILVATWHIYMMIAAATTVSHANTAAIVRPRDTNKRTVSFTDSCLPPRCTVRRYYIAAEDILWDYAPSGQDMVYHRELTGPLAPLKHGDRRTYKKTVYRGYEDGTFTKRTPREDWLGILGPTIHAEVGDVIEVVFRNKAKETYSIHPHGVFYTLENEGASHVYATEGAGVLPDHTFTYQWNVTERAGPAQEDAGSILWMYHSHHDEAKDINVGLVGSMIIYRRGWLRSIEESSAVINATIEQLEELKHTPWAASVPNYPGTSLDVYPRATTRYNARDTDREFVILINIFDENNTPYYLENMLLVQEGAVAAPAGTGDVDSPGANMEQMKRHQFASINGRVLGNLAGLTAQQQERVRWHLAAFGTEDAIHHVRWHGASGPVTERGYRTNGVSLLPATFRTIDTILDMAGRWILNCQNVDHNERGLFSWYHVIARSNGTAASQEATNISVIKDQAVIDAQVDAAIQKGSMNMMGPDAMAASPSPPPDMSATSWIMLIGVIICWLIGTSSVFHCIFNCS